MIYDFTEASREEAFSLAMALSEELAGALRQVAIGYTVAAVAEIDIDFPFPLLVRISRIGDQRRWSYGFFVSPVANSENMTLELLSAFRRFKRDYDNKHGVPMPQDATPEQARLSLEATRLVIKEQRKEGIMV